ncbi:ABC transporter permease [Longirhabdus pacifica]|uniref:ABC transporter permease n=1 Tax=Longirhabdus pacifica TaxID=2305227 RepID=UPI001008C1A8|nr:ABC transporter permease [Longirhabdus pacifica]
MEQQQLNTLQRAQKRKQQRERQVILLTQISILVGGIGLWELAARLAWIDPLLFSMPSKIALLFWEKWNDGSLWIHMSVTLYETIAGFLLGTLFGVMIATMLWWSPFLSRVLDPYLVIFNAMPKVALGPMIIVAFGPTQTSIIAMGILICVIITTLVVYAGFKEVDVNKLKVIQTFGGNKLQLYTQVVLPATVPIIISALKVNVGLAWVGVIVGEFLVSKEGLGYLIIYGFQVFQFTLVMLSMIIIAIFATIMYQLIYILEKYVVKNNK